MNPTPKDLPFKQIRQTTLTNQPQIQSISIKKDSTNIKKTTKKLCIFMSYATKDAQIFNIREIVNSLKTYENINEVLFWEENCKDNIIDYMDKNLGKCNLLLLFYSPNSVDSEPVKKEWTAAEGLNKPIVPIFIKKAHIPPLLNNREGIEFDPFDFQKNI